MEQPVPIGYLVTVALLAWCTLFALAPPRPRHSSPSNLSYWFGFLVNKLPVVGWAWLAASTLLALAQGDLDSPGAWAAVGLAAVTAAGLVVVARRGLRAGPAVEQALDAAAHAHRRGRRPTAPRPPARPCRSRRAASTTRATNSATPRPNRKAYSGRRSKVSPPR